MSEELAIEAGARAMCDRVNGIGDYDENIAQRRAGWFAQTKVGIDAYLAALAAEPDSQNEEDTPCTDCEDTGMTIQTERPCSCLAGDEFRLATTPARNTSQIGEGA